MLSIRLSDEEFRRLQDTCVQTNARSVSDLAREAMQRIAGPVGGVSPRAADDVHLHLRELGEKLDSLQLEVSRLMHLVGGGQPGLANGNGAVVTGNSKE